MRGASFLSDTTTLDLIRRNSVGSVIFPFDYGVKEVTTRLSQLLGVTAVLGRYSRLVIDLNRSINDPGLIPTEAHDKPIPGNLGIDASERTTRRTRFYDPYHSEIDRIIKARRAAREEVMLLDVHSYTPKVGFKAAGIQMPPRGIDISLMHRNENPLLQAFRDGLRVHPEIEVGENIPYDLRKLNTGSIIDHGVPLGLSFLAVEISIERLLPTADGSVRPEDVSFWVAVLAECVKTVL
jgi:predicted N-formylglutamate amidohydrolase